MYHYSVKVRDKTLLWGTVPTTAPEEAELKWPLLLVVHNELYGADAHLTGGTKNFGMLQPGACYTVPLLGLRSVFAKCDTDTTIQCCILVPHVGPPA